MDGIQGWKKVLRGGGGDDLSCFEYGPLGIMAIMALSRSSIFLNFIFFFSSGKSSYKCKNHFKL